MKKRDLRKKICEEIRAEQAGYDERTRHLEEYLRRAGIPTGSDDVSYAARTRLLEEAIQRYRLRLGPAPRRESS